MFEFVILNLKTKNIFCFVFTLNALKVWEFRKKIFFIAVPKNVPLKFF